MIQNDDPTVTIEDVTTTAEAAPGGTVMFAVWTLVGTAPGLAYAGGVFGLLAAMSGPSWVEVALHVNGWAGAYLLLSWMRGSKWNVYISTKLEKYDPTPQRRIVVTKIVTAEPEGDDE